MCLANEVLISQNLRHAWGQVNPDPQSLLCELKVLTAHGCSFPQIRAATVFIQEGGVHLDLTLVDTPGFGDVVDNTDW